MSFSMWVGNVYQKFGAMCLGIEDAVYKDSIAYVENQVQTVGESVKKFCSGMMQDLHPVSLLDPVGVVFADMSVNPYAYLEIEKNKKKEDMKDHVKSTDDMKSADDTQVIKGRSNLGGIHRRRNVGTIKRTEGSDPPLMASLPVTLKSRERKDMKSPVYEIGETSEEICVYKVGSPATSKSWGRNKMKSPVCEIGEMLEGTCDHKVDLPVTSKPWESNNMKSPVCEIGEESLEEIFVQKEDNKMQATGSSIDNVASEEALLVGSPIFETAENEIFDHKEDNKMQTTGSSIDNVASEVALFVGSTIFETAENEIFDHKEDNNMQKTGRSIDNVASEVTLLAGSSSTSSGTQEADLPDSTIWLSTISDSGDSETSEKHYFEVVDEANDVLEQEEQENDEDVEETCILVEGGGLLLPHDLVKHKSYKTKIREAFSSKKRLTKKEYKRLAKQYEEQGLDEDCEGKNALFQKNDEISSGWDFPDSEWELV